MRGGGTRCSTNGAQAAVARMLAVIDARTALGGKSYAKVAVCLAMPLCHFIASRYILFCCRDPQMGADAMQVWKDSFFQPVALRDLGLIVQLGEDHPPGTFCFFGQDLNKEFIVLHTNGLHSVRVRSCGCTPPNTAAIDVYKQLIRAGLYPATPYEPKTCGTFALMRLAHGLSLQGKVSAYNFYKSLHYYTDNTGIVKIPVSFCFSSYLLFLFLV